MFNLRSDRLDYRYLLSPPPQYKTVFAVGTTYSLDLETLIATCAIVGLNIEADTELTESPLYMLEALRKTSGKLLIFYQGGQIKLPEKPNGLLPLLDNCAIEVNLKNKKSFHPKTWFIKYSANGLPDKYRLIILSRNLTFDRSWDVAIRLDSAGKGDEAIKNSRITRIATRDFLLWLVKNTSTHNKLLRTKKRLLEELAYEFNGIVEWKNLGREYSQIDFIPYGIYDGNTIKSRSDNSDIGLFDTFHEMLVISPFLSKGIIEKFAANRLVNSDCTLITRKSELPKLNEELLTVFETYTVKDDVVDGEDQISGHGDNRTQDIHAKIYLRTKSSNSELYIGSANASHSAFYGGNVECLLRLCGKRRYLNVKKLKSDLFGDNDKSNPFEKAASQDYTDGSEDVALQKLENCIRDFCGLKKSAIVSGDGTYTITITASIRTFDADGIKFTLSPTMMNSAQSIKETMIFNGLALRDLSEWFTVTASANGQELSRIIKIQTDGIPENRDSAVFSNIVKEKNSFLTFIAFQLSDDYLSAFLEGLKRGNADYRSLSMSYDDPILYEPMLKTAATEPENLREVRETIELANNDIVPQDFVRLYEQFEKAVKL
jgi:HKD family nuclease